MGDRKKRRRNRDSGVRTSGAKTRSSGAPSRVTQEVHVHVRPSTGLDPRSLREVADVQNGVSLPPGITPQDLSVGFGPFSVGASRGLLVAAWRQVRRLLHRLGLRLFGANDAVHERLRLRDLLVPDGQVLIDSGAWRPGNDEAASRQGALVAALTTAPAKRHGVRLGAKTVNEATVANRLVLGAPTSLPDADEILRTLERTGLRRGAARVELTDAFGGRAEQTELELLDGRLVDRQRLMMYRAEGARPTGSQQPDGYVVPHYLLISVLPDVGDERAYRSGKRVALVSEGTGISTQTIADVLNNEQVLEAVRSLIGEACHYQAAIRVSVLHVWTSGGWTSTPLPSTVELISAVGFEFDEELVEAYMRQRKPRFA